MSRFNFYHSSIFPVKAVQIPQVTLDVADTKKQITYNKNTLTAAFCPAWRLDREMRRRLILQVT